MLLNKDLNKLWLDDDRTLEKIIFTGDIHNMSMDGSDQKQALKIN